MLYLLKSKIVSTLVNEHEQTLKGSYYDSTFSALASVYCCCWLSCIREDSVGAFSKRHCFLHLFDLPNLKLYQEKN